jgi:hypothetical protein
MRSGSLHRRRRNAANARIIPSALDSGRSDRPSHHHRGPNQTGGLGTQTGGPGVQTGGCGIQIGGCGIQIGGCGIQIGGCGTHGGWHGLRGSIQSGM